ncbi:hypothetical protein V1477_020602, partial [Vespula maculifrons]
FHCWPATISLAEPRANSKAGSTGRDSSASSGHRAYLETRKLATHPRVRPNAHARTRRSKILLIHCAEPAAAAVGGGSSAWITQRRLLESPKESLIRGEYTAYAAAISRGAFNFVTHSTALSRKYIRHLKPALSARGALIRLTASCSEMLLLV